MCNRDRIKPCVLWSRQRSSAYLAGEPLITRARLHGHQPPENADMNAILFCGCMVHPALRSSPKWAAEFSKRRYGWMAGVHNYGQVFQIIEVLRGEKTIPPELLVACHLPPSLRPVAGAATFADVDLIILEVSTPVELTYRGHQLHVFGINQKMLKPLFNSVPGLYKAAGFWRKGLYGFDDSIRAEGAAQMLNLLAGDTERDLLLRSVIEETRSSPTNVALSLRRFREIFPGAIGVILNHFKYLPGGRIIDWPQGFSDEICRTAKDLDIPVFDPAPMVIAADPEKVIGADGAHYTQEFLPAIGAEITEFALSVARPA